MLSNMRYCWYLLSVAATVCLLSSEARGWSSGRWNMPSTPAQYFGYGYGPGHHAPALRMPCCQPMDGPRVVFTPDCPQSYCHSCGMYSPGSTLQRELGSPAESLPAPGPTLQMYPGQSRDVPWNSYVR